MESQSSQINLQHYRWPAEWEPHVATWTAWPVNKKTWPGIFDRIPAAFAELVAAIAGFEPVNILAGQETQRNVWPLVEAACSKNGAGFDVRFVDIAVNDSWCRDYGPMFLNRRPNLNLDQKDISNGTLVRPPSAPQRCAADQIVLNWGYNAWGEKYPPWELDAEVTGSGGMRWR